MKNRLRMLPTVLLAIATVAPANAQGDERGPNAARAVIRRYYIAIDAGNFRKAYILWGSGGRASGRSYDVFRRGFAATAHTRVDAGKPMNGDAGAGSIYVDVPVNVYSVLKNGGRQHFRGIYTLRRVNDVDGATRSQLRWHIASAALRRVG